VSHSRTSRYLSLFFSLLFCVAAAPAWAAPEINGVVVDPGGRPVPRAHVRVLDASGNETASAFADEEGRFHLDASGTCRVEAALAGFEAVTLPCSTSAIRLTLALAPIEETVIVTATGTETPASQVGASTSVFTAKDLETRREPLVADLLRTTPGAMVIRTGAPGGVTSLFVRGGESNYNKVLIDGIPINEPGGTFNFSNLTTDNLDRIEIVRGAHSALYGSDAMASVVQIFTKHADHMDPHPHGTATFEAGTFNTWNGTASATGATGKFDYSLGAARLSTDNQGVNDKFDNTALTLNSGVDLGHNATLRVIGRAELQHAGTPGQTAINPPDLDGLFERHDALGGVTFDQALTPSFHQHAVYSFGVSNQVSTDLVSDSPSDFTYDNTTNLHRQYASYQADVRLPHAANADHLLTVLADWNGERIHATDRMAFDPADAESLHSRNNFGASIQEQALWSRVFLTAGGRIEHNDNFGTAAVPRGSMVIVAREGRGSVGETRLHVSGGLGIKEATALQSFSTNAFFKGNPDLKPERSRSFEAGIDQRFANDRAKVEATWFDSRFTDQITLIGTQYQNLSQTRARGAEVGIELAPIPMLHLNGEFTLLESSVVASASTSIQFQPGAELFRRPRHSGAVGATLAHDRYSLNVNGLFVGQFQDNDFSFPATTLNPGYTLWNARLSVSIARQLSVLGSIDNIANAAYTEPLGYPALGRAGRLGVRVGF
jgi:outer membrane cobalamin receptor